VRRYFANASQHLRHVFYRLTDDVVLDLLASLRRIAERNVAEVAHVARSYFDSRDALEPVSRKDLMRRLRTERVTIAMTRNP
jgi:hypothetical protein